MTYLVPIESPSDTLPKTNNENNLTSYPSALSQQLSCRAVLRATSWYHSEHRGEGIREGDFHPDFLKRDQILRTLVETG